MARPALTTSCAKSTSVSYSHAEYSQTSSRSTSASSVWSDSHTPRPIEAPLAPPAKKAKRLVLCFDGTGNEFCGTTADTNVVKIFDKLKRNDDMQYHYYQTGIGTYDIGGGSVNKSYIGALRSHISKTIDTGLATTFDAHVMSGYRFLMQYYDTGDHIYMFGFSRGAYTARFLSRMVGTIGLLSRGNEEMIPFAYSLYQNYERGFHKLAKDTTTVDNLNDDLGIVDRDLRADRDKLATFTTTFCRRQEIGDGKYRGIQVLFLGLFDCVGSVSVLENPFSQPSTPVEVVGHAKHMRHAVAVDERRVKFRAALMAQDKSNEDAPKDGSTSKEVWFPGNHGDVGGGWEARKPIDPKNPPSLWQKMKAFIFGHTPDQNAHTDPKNDPFQLRDIPLAWMIRELEELKEDKSAKLTWNGRRQGFESNFQRKAEDARKSAKHDTMIPGGGSSFFKAMFWQLLELLPLMPRKELDAQGKWVTYKWMPNFGATRDIPIGALLHRSLIDRLKDDSLRYRPRNNHGGRTQVCFDSKTIDSLVEEFPHDAAERQDQSLHQLYTFK